MEGLVPGQEVLGKAADAVKFGNIQVQRDAPVLSQDLIDCLCSPADVTPR